MTGPSTTRIRRLGLVLVAVLLFATACASDAPLDTMEPEGPAAREIDGLFNVVFIIAAVVFVLVQSGIVYILYRFRRRRGDNDLPEQIHGNLRLELAWTILPAVLLVFVAVATVTTLFALEERDADAVPVTVTGQQWWWQYTYEVEDLVAGGLIPDQDYQRDAIITANEMVIPAARQMDLVIASRDVIHSFWIPRLNGKRDAVPGRAHTLSMEADNPGEFLGNCTEFCGLSHSRMRMSVRAVTDEEFTEWAVNQLGVAARPDDPSDAALAGWETFRTVCSGCHLVDGGGAGENGWGNEDLYDPDNVNQEAGVAPDLTHFMTRPRYAGAIFDLYEPDAEGNIPTDPAGRVLNRTQLEEWLRDPPGQKAMYAQEIPPEESLNGRLIKPRGMLNLNLTDDQIDDLVEYLVTLD